MGKAGIAATVLALAAALTHALAPGFRRDGWRRIGRTAEVGGHHRCGAV